MITGSMSYRNRWIDEAGKVIRSGRKSKQGGSLFGGTTSHRGDTGEHGGSRSGIAATKKRESTTPLCQVWNSALRLNRSEERRVGKEGRARGRWTETKEGRE